MNFDEKSRIYPDSGCGKSCPIRSPTEKTLIFIIAVVVAVVVGLSISMVNINSANEKEVEDLENIIKTDSNICFSASCISEASDLKKSMDLTVDPCEDFYSFVCGNWIKRSHLVSTLESQFTRLTTSIILRVKEILETSQTKTGVPEHKKKTLDFYNACMDKAHRNRIGARELHMDLQKFGGWPLIDEDWDPTSFDWADLMVELFKNGYINNMLFSVKIGEDAKNTSQSLIKISQPSLGLINPMYYSFPFDDMLISYKEAIFKLAKHFKRRLDKEKAMTEIDKAVKIEKKIASISKEVNLKDPDFFYNIMTIEELERFAPQIPWRKILKGMLPQGTRLMAGDRIEVTVPSMIKGLTALLHETGKKSLANYMLYRTVFYAAHHLSKELYFLVNDVTSTSRAGATLWETCVKTAIESFPHSLTANYATEYLNNQTKILLEMMLGDLKNSLLDDIQSAEWLDAETKEYALLKVKKMKRAIAYQEEIMHDEVLNDFYSGINITNDHFRNMKEITAFKLRHSMEGLHDVRKRLQWFDVNNLLTANAYYYPGQNSIIIPVGVLQDPIFATNRPNYINYGSLGMVVGHELTHAFDSIGSLYNAEGSYHMWWSNDSWNQFVERTKCYEKQYNHYFMTTADAYVNGTLTLSENIADNGGLQTAYHAYNKLLKRIGSEKSLPGLPYNEKQMFWISFGSVWCRKQTKESIQYALSHSVHTPSRFRVIGSPSNMEEFSQDFNCKSNATMNPESRCSLWK